MAAYHGKAQTNVPGGRMLYGQFTGANGTNPTASTVKGLGIASVTRSAEGVYAVTLSDSQADFGTLVHASAQVNDAVSGDAQPKTATVHVNTTPATPVIEIHTRANGALDDCEDRTITFMILTTNSLGSGII